MNFDLEYNSGRTNLIIPEYGRHIQKLVDHCKALETKEEREEMANAIIDVMGNLQPHLRDVPDFKHKLWDQLFMMAEFDLDVESPYGKPTAEVIYAKPEKLDYPKSASKYKFYGNNIQTMVDVALSWDDGEMKEALVLNIANHMKKCYLNWNKDTVDNAVIFHHLWDISDGKIDLRKSEISLASTQTLLRKSNSGRMNQQQKSQPKNNHRNNNNRGRTQTQNSNYKKR